MKSTKFTLMLLCLWLTSNIFSNAVFAQNYCTATGNTYGGGLSYYGIQSVSTTGATTNFTNSQGLFNSFSSGYENFSSTYIVSTEQGSSFTLQTSAISTDYDFWGVWIDWNHDGDFEDAGEELYLNNTTSANTLSLVINVPIDATVATTRMRIIGAAGGVGGSPPYSQSISGPCMTGVLEAEDYGVVIAATTPQNCGPLSAGTIIQSSPMNVCSGTPFTWVAQGATSINAVTYKWQSRSPIGTGQWIDIPNSNSTTLIVQGITVSTEYQFIVTCTLDGSSATSAAVVANVISAPLVTNINATQVNEMTYNFEAIGANASDNFNWNFGDGGSSTLSTPQHTYAATGTYTVTVSVSNTCGTSSTTMQLQIGNTGIEDVNNTSNIRLFPNPATNLITISNDNATAIEGIVIYNAVGQKVFESNMNTTQKEWSIDISPLASGLYHAKIMLKNGNTTATKIEVRK